MSIKTEPHAIWQEYEKAMQYNESIGLYDTEMCIRDRHYTMDNINNNIRHRKYCYELGNKMRLLQ